MTGHLLRSLLYAPANRPDLVSKTQRFAPDAVVIDLEDGTPPSHKVPARSLAAQAARDLTDRFTGSIWLRVNTPADPALFDDDLACFAAGAFDGVVVPKTETPEDVARTETALAGLGADSRPVIWGIETVLGVHNAPALLGASERGVAAYFGAEDYVADLGGRRTPQSTETLWARTQVSMACRMAGITPVDQVVTDFGDIDRFLADAAVGTSLGYRGKNCIHPSQVPLCHEAYTPSADAVGRARRLLDCYERALAQGRGTAAFEGQMIDGPLVAQARTTVVLASASDHTSRGDSARP
ncbi:HpcH/HpaI aldolase/citrate lyase family protein [Streptomyces phaeochromogenes]|uniref:HpcH/HpaI aldolase/citrate lyase family protein n=1 Tax=Streptomyces phaeochromogenes TaxID=1923 RepID=UPI0036B21FAC